MKKVLIFGFGDIGLEIQQHLQMPNENIIVIDTDPERVLLAIEHGCNAYNLDLTKDENLISVGVGMDIDFIFCVTNNDELNLFVTLSARALDKRVKILSRAQDIHQKHKLILAGANKAIDLNEITATNIFNLIKRPRVYDVVEGIVYKENAFFFKNELEISEIEIPEGSFLDGEYLISVRLDERFDLLALGLLDNELSEHFMFNVGRLNHKIDAGDILVVLGRLTNIEALKSALQHSAKEYDYGV